MLVSCLSHVMMPDVCHKFGKVASVAMLWRPGCRQSSPSLLGLANGLFIIPVCCGSAPIYLYQGKISSPIHTDEWAHHPHHV